VLAGAVALAEQKVLTGADLRNRVYTKDHVLVRGKIGAGLECVLYDAQTSGGLLIAAPASTADALVAKLRESGMPAAARVGEVLAKSAHTVVVD
jgi:selenide,water dikinase